MKKYIEWLLIHNQSFLPSEQDNSFPSSFLDLKKKRHFFYLRKVSLNYAYSTWEKWYSTLHLRVAQPLQLQHKEAYNINHIQIPATYATVTISIVNFRCLPAGCCVKTARNYRRSHARYLRPLRKTVKKRTRNVVFVMFATEVLNQTESKSSSKVSLNADNMYLLFEIKLMFTFKSVYYSMDVSTLSLIQWWLYFTFLYRN